MPSLRDAVGRPPEKGTAFEKDVAGCRLVEPRQAVEQRCLARAVGTDQSEDLAALKPKGYFVKRDNASEAHGKIAHFKQGLCRLVERPRHLRAAIERGRRLQPVTTKP